MIKLRIKTQTLKEMDYFLKSLSLTKSFTNLNKAVNPHFTRDNLYTLFINVANIGELNDLEIINAGNNAFSRTNKMKVKKQVIKTRGRKKKLSNI